METKKWTLLRDSSQLYKEEFSEWLRVKKLKKPSAQQRNSASSEHLFPSKVGLNGFVVCAHRGPSTVGPNGSRAETTSWKNEATFFRKHELSPTPNSKPNVCTEALLRMATPWAGFRGITLYDVTPFMKAMSKSKWTRKNKRSSPEIECVFGPNEDGDQLK